MKRLGLALAVMGVLGAGGAASAQDYSYRTATVPDSNVHVVRQQRGIFNAVRVNRNLPRQVCGGAEPVDVHVFHTVGDGLAAVLTGILWTPAHLRVTCPPQAAQR